MAKKSLESESTDLATMNVPSYPDTYRGQGTDDIPPSTELARVKIIQGMSKAELKKEYGEGAIILRPDDVRLCDVDGSFTASIVFFFMSWSHWADINENAELPVLETTLDPMHTIAMKAKNPSTREYMHGQFKRRYVEEMNFVVSIVAADEAVPGTVAVVTYSRGGHKAGRALRERLRRAGANGAPLYANVIKFSPAITSNKKGQSWQAIAWEPAGFLKPEELAEAQAKYLSVKAAYDAQKIAVAQDVDTPAADPHDDDV